MDAIDEAREKLVKAKRAASRANSDLIIAQEHYDQLIMAWWREAMKESEEREARRSPA